MSGLSHTPGKRARGYTLRGFESRLLRQMLSPVSPVFTGLFSGLKVAGPTRAPIALHATPTVGQSCLHQLFSPKRASAPHTTAPPNASSTNAVTPPAKVEDGTPASSR